jgi:hypothetical protein
LKPVIIVQRSKGIKYENYKDFLKDKDNNGASKEDNTNHAPVTRILISPRSKKGDENSRDKEVKFRIIAFRFFILFLY